MPSPSRSRLPLLPDLDVDNRSVFVRVDWNVPLDEAGAITDDTRIRATLPTLIALRERGARLVVASHLGRPDGAYDAAYSMEPVAARVAALLDCEVQLPDTVVGDSAAKLVRDARATDLIVLENLRFEPGETKNDPQFAAALAALAQVYVNDAFGASHRAHASIVGVPAILKDHGAGLLLEREITALSRVLSPERPFVAVVGGAKVSDKLGVLGSLLDRLRAGDSVLIGGAMANTFLLATGCAVGSSKVEKDRVADCRRFLESAAARDVRVELPTDVRTATELNATSGAIVPTSRGLEATQMALDIGPHTARLFAERIATARTVLWNGPMGRFENPAFAEGTNEIARAVAACPGYTVVGGGDSISAVSHLENLSDIDHLSTGGGASLEFLEFGTLPGIEALRVPVTAADPS